MLSKNCTSKGHLIVFLVIYTLSEKLKFLSSSKYVIIQILKIFISYLNIIHNFKTLNTKKKKTLQISLALEDKWTHKACASRWPSRLSQGWQSCRTKALSRTLACKSKVLSHPKPDILRYTYPKYTTNLSVSTLPTQKKVCVG